MSRQAQHMSQFYSVVIHIIVCIQSTTGDTPHQFHLWGSGVDPCINMAQEVHKKTLTIYSLQYILFTALFLVLTVSMVA